MTKKALRSEIYHSPTAFVNYFAHRSDTLLRSLDYSHHEVSAMLLGLRLIRASNEFIRAQERTSLAKYELRWTRFHVLLVLRLSEVADSSLIAQLLGVSRQAASTVIASMRRDGLVEALPRDEGDARVLPLQLSEKGQALIDDALGDALSSIEAWSSRLTSEERELFNSMLHVLIFEERPEPQNDSADDPASADDSEE